MTLRMLLLVGFAIAGGCGAGTEEGAEPDESGQAIKRVGGACTLFARTAEVVDIEQECFTVTDSGICSGHDTGTTLGHCAWVGGGCHALCPHQL